MASTFTRIIRRELPADIVYEDDHTIAFLDMHPKAEGHTLVVPKLEVASFHDLPPDVLTHLASTVQKVARGITKAIGTPHYNLDLNNGRPAGQVIFHVHFHIIPRRDGAPMAKLPLHLSAERMEEIAEAIRRAVAEPE